MPVTRILRRALDSTASVILVTDIFSPVNARASSASRQFIPPVLISPINSEAWKGSHSFRRGFGTNLYRLGVSPKVIQETSGTPMSPTTETHYIVVDRTETKIAMKKVEKAVARNGQGQNVRWFLKW